MNVEDLVTSQWFQEQADRRIDSVRQLREADSLKHGSIVYSRGWNHFFELYHQHIKEPYVLISNFHDRAIDYIPEQVEGPKCLHWFGVNMAVEHPKMTPIPLAMDSQRMRYMKEGNDLRCGVYLNCTKNTTERTALYADALSNGWTAQDHNKHDVAGYFNQIANHAFIACPRGNGQDTYRVWEVLAMGSTPIVKTSFLDRLYKDYPIAIVSDWTDTPSRPNQTLERLTKSYWREQLNRWKD